MPGGHPTDSSRVLLGLMNLSRKAEEAASTGSETAMLDGVISKALLRSLLSALHFRDVATVRHSRRTANLAVGMGTYLGWEGVSYGSSHEICITSPTRQRGENGVMQVPRLRFGLASVELRNIADFMR